MAKSYYGLSSQSVDIANANNLTATGGGSTTTNTPGTQTFDFGGWMELLSHGGSTSVLGAIGSPNGRGWILDDTTLEGATIPGGVWTALFTLTASVASATGDLYIRFYDLDVIGTVYTEIGETHLTAQTVTTGGVAFTLSTASLSAYTFGGAGHKLYCDIWWHQTGGGTPANLISVAVASTTSGVPGASGGFELQVPSSGGTVNGSATVGGSAGGLALSGSVSLGAATVGASAGGLALGGALALGAATLGGSPGGLFLRSSNTPGSVTAVDAALGTSSATDAALGSVVGSVSP